VVPIVKRKAPELFFLEPFDLRFTVLPHEKHRALLKVLDYMEHEDFRSKLLCNLESLSNGLVGVMRQVGRNENSKVYNVLR
jgi:hypothetical protein